MAIRTANNQSLTEITALPSAVALGGLVLLATETASSSDLITFDSNIDSTYKEYIFKFIDIHPETDGSIFQVNFRDGGSSYDATKTTAFFDSYHYEDDSGTPAIGYAAAADLAQSTGTQRVAVNVGGDNDQCTAGYLHLFDPSNTTFVKQFICRMNTARNIDQTVDSFMAGYCNVTAAIDGVQFSMSADAIDAGTIKLYGVT